MTKVYCTKGLHPWIKEHIKIDPKTGNQRCIPCKKEYDTNYRKSHSQESSEYQHAYYQEHKEQKQNHYRANRDKKLEASRKRRQENKELLQEYDRKYHIEHREGKLEYLKTWRELNPDYQQNWNKENPDKKREIDRKAGKKRRARRLNQLGIVSPDIEKMLWENQKGICFYCSDSLEQTGYHLEHMIPLSRGGYHEDNNLCLSCPDCNWRKNTRTAEEFQRRIENETKG